MGESSFHWLMKDQSDLGEKKGKREKEQILLSLFCESHILLDIKAP